MNPLAMTAAEYRALTKLAAPRSKYGAKPVRKGDRFDGLTFPSQVEAKRYDALRLRERAGEIVPGSIELQPRFVFVVNGQKVGTYKADFAYVTTGDFKRHVEDVKGVRTREFIRAKKLMRACHGIEVEEVGERRTRRRRSSIRGKR